MFNDSERKKAFSRAYFAYSGREPGGINFKYPEIPRALLLRRTECGMEKVIMKDLAPITFDTKALSRLK
jgi:hypothetical protein